MKEALLREEKAKKCVYVYLLRLQPEGLVSDLTGTLLLSDCDSVFLLRDRGAATFFSPCRRGCALVVVVVRSILSSLPALEEQLYGGQGLSPL